MALSDASGASVLILECDGSIRRMLQALLARAGFRVRLADGDALQAPLGESFDVIVRDVNLAPRNREVVLQELARTGAEELQRTVITTTSPAVLQKYAGDVQAFAVIAKPFDVDVLVAAVRKCADRSRNGRAARAAAKTEGDGKDRAPVDVEQLRRFVGSVPVLRALLAGEPGSTRELMLRNEMRRKACELASVLDDAARRERNRTRAAMLAGVALVAAKLARGGPAVPLQAAGHDH